MKSANDLPTAPPSATPLDPQHFPLQPQMPATADRDSLRETKRVQAPRQSKRPVERSK